jgi:large subunit ribosomal protein L18
MTKRRPHRSKIKSTSDRLRLSVFRSNSEIYAQVIDDEKNVTIVSASSIKLKNGGGREAAATVGKDIAEKALKQKVKKVVFDRGNHLYHGRVKALADAAREHGLEF